MLSISGARDLFIVANWNSYSKSDTALSPLIIAQAFCSFAISTVSCLGKPTTSTWELSLYIEVASLILSSKENKGFFASFFAIAITILSNSPHALSMISICPYVIGSNDPG